MLLNRLLAATSGIDVIPRILRPSGNGDTASLPTPIIGCGLGPLSRLIGELAVDLAVHEVLVTGVQFSRIELAEHVV